MTVEADWFSPEPDETVVWSGQPRLKRILPTAARSFVVSMVALVAAFAGTTWLLSQLPPRAVAGLPVPAPLVVWLVAVLVVVWQLASVALAYLRVEQTDYVLTDRRVYRKTGVLSEQVSSLGVERVQETTLSKDFFGNLFDYGTVAISTAGSGGTDMALTDLTDPETFRDRLNEQVRASGGRATGDDGGVDADTAAALLTEARGLREVAERLEESV